MPGLLVIVSGPSGVGKTTIAQRVAGQMEGVLSISMTTRPPASTESDGVDYHFVDRATFESLRSRGELLEWAEVFGNLYGTPKRPVAAVIDRGGIVILEIDVEGAVQVKTGLRESFAIFINPPSEQALLERLRGRGRDDEPAIQRRFAKAKQEMQRAVTCGAYDAFVVNSELQLAVGEVIDLVAGEMAHRSSA